MPILYSRDLPLRGFARPVSPVVRFRPKYPSVSLKGTTENVTSFPVL